MSTISKRPLLKVAEVARILSCSEMTVYRRIRDGSLSHIRFGHLIRIPRRVLEEVVDSSIKGN